MTTAGSPRRALPPRQVVLFVLAIALPSLAIVLLGLRLMGQERELAATRAADERRRIVAEARQALAERLGALRADAVAAQAAAAGLPPEPIVFTAPVRAGRLGPPWNADGVRARLQADPAARHLEAGERAEARQPQEAAAAFRRAAASADPLFAAHAQLALARVLARAGHTAQAAGIDAALATTAFDLTDEYGMPLAIYAAQRLAGRGEPIPAAFLEASRASLRPGRWPAPAACYAIQELAAHATAASDAALRQWARDVQPLAAARAAAAERVLALEAEVPALLPRRGGAGGDRWTLSAGAPDWLIGTAPLAGGDTLLLAVDAPRLVAALPPVPGAAGLALTARPGAGDPLGDSFPGARLVYTPADPGAGAERARLQRGFYAAVLAMVLAVAAIGTFVLWRDVRREMRLSALRTRFVAGVSHELKTPLTSIRMFAETLRMGRGMDQAARHEYLDTIVNESERLTRLLNNVLDFSRIEQASKTYHFAATDLAAAIRAAVRTIEYPLAQEGFELRLALAGDVPAVPADADAVQQAVLNLLTNAMKYSGASRRIDVALARQEGHAVISVTDAGAGIAPADQRRVFERFYRAPTPENQHIAGTGLGLTIVRHIAEAHGGLVDVDSHPGAGSTFRLRLPLGGAPAPAAAPAEARA